MHPILTFLVWLVFTTMVWVVVLCIYNFTIEAFDFGILGWFLAKSAGLLFVVTLLVAFVPAGGLASLVVWWIGLMLIFKKDFWECRVLVILIWGVSFILGFAIKFLLAEWSVAE